MAITVFKTFIAGEVLTAADLNASLTQFTSNDQSIGNPRTTTFDMDGFELILDADADSSFTVDIDDRLDLKLQGQDLFKFDGTVASAMNGVTFVASAAGSPAQITTHGTDAAIDLLIDPKSTGKIDINGTELVLDADADSSLRETADDIIALKLRGQDLVKFDGATGGTTVNGFTLLTSATGAPVQLQAQGSDADINLLLEPKGTGVVDLDGATLTIDADADSTLRATADDVVALRLQGVDAFIFDGDAASPVNGLTFKSSATTVSPTIEAQGSDSLINVRLAPKGADGVVASAGGFAVDGATALTWRWQGSSTNLILQENTGTPTVPTWTTRNTFLTGIGIASGLQLLQTYRPAAASAVDITSQITSTYDTYLIAAVVTPGADGGSLTLRTDSNNGASFDNGVSDYDYWGLYRGPNLDDELTSAAAGAIIMTSDAVNNGVGNGTGEGIMAFIWVNRIGIPYIQFDVTYTESGDATIVRGWGAGERRSTSDIDAVRLAFNTGSVTITGKVEIYGVVGSA